MSSSSRIKAGFCLLVFLVIIATASLIVLLDGLDKASRIFISGAKMLGIFKRQEHLVVRTSKKNSTKLTLDEKVVILYWTRELKFEPLVKFNPKT